MSEQTRSHTTIDSILFPTDFSDASRSALEDAASWARSFGARLHLLHVVVPHEPYFAPTASVAGPPTATIMEAIEETAKERLAEEFKAVPDPVPQLEGHCRRGAAPAEVIVAFAEEHEVDLVVMSSHGRRGFRRLLLGSVTEEVVRRSPCPVLVERRDAEAQPSAGVDRILVPVDFSAASRQSLELAQRLASTFRTEIDLVTVIQDPIYPAFYGAGEMPAIVQQSAEVEERTRKELERLGRELQRDVVSETFLRRGDAALEIVDHARERRCGLIVISTHGLSGLSRLLLGSVTEKVLRRAACPVFVVPASIAFGDQTTSSR